MTNFNKVDLGSIKIHKHVLAEISKAAVEEIDGVTLAPPGFAGSLLDLCGIKNYSGISVAVDKDNTVTLEIKIHIRYGLQIPDTARQVQDAVREAVERATDVDLRDVHVSVHGVDRVEKSLG